MRLGLNSPTTLTRQSIHPRTSHQIFTQTPKYPSLHWSSSSSLRTRAAAVGERSFYELLGVPEETGYDGIKRAYKQLARMYHPDVSPPDRAEEFTRRFIDVPMTGPSTLPSQPGRHFIRIWRRILTGRTIGSTRLKSCRRRACARKTTFLGEPECAANMLSHPKTIYYTSSSSSELDINECS